VTAVGKDRVILQRLTGQRLIVREVPPELEE
jgi:hypothetical protein